MAWLECQCLALQRSFVDLAVRQAREDLDPAHEAPELVTMRLVALGTLRAHIPMRDERLARPVGQLLRGRLAERDDEIHARRAGRAELLERLRAQGGHRQLMPGEELEDVGMRCLLACDAGAVRAKARCADGRE